MPWTLVAEGESGMSPVQSSPSLQWCLSGASELPSTTCHSHSQQQHTHPVTVARINWWPLTVNEVAAVLSLGPYLSCLVCKSQITPTTEHLGRCAKCDNLQALKHFKKQWRGYPAHTSYLADRVHAKASKSAWKNCNRSNLQCDTVPTVCT